MAQEAKKSFACEFSLCVWVGGMLMLFFRNEMEMHNSKTYLKSVLLLVALASLILLLRKKNEKSLVQPKATQIVPTTHFVWPRLK